ncbi:MAG TPA: carboxypeptidase-like regulatory domain-containing protein, partial [Adhaeribacter sp.]|nr:carboxypeptidase-like regulatory domain-containing protein [Adhaeribacter sp.]
MPWLLLWLTLPVFGQEARQNCGLTLSGQVTDHDTREPLIGAVIYIPELQEGTVSDAFGTYHFHDVCEGTYTLTFTYLGYENLKTEVKMRSSLVYNFK